MSGSFMSLTDHFPTQILVPLSDYLVPLTSLFPISTYETMPTSRVETNQHL